MKKVVSLNIRSHIIIHNWRLDAEYMCVSFFL